MEILRIIVRTAGWVGVALLVLGLAGGAFDAGLISVVHRAVEQTGGRSDLLLAFGALALCKVTTAHVSGSLLARHAARSVAQLRLSLVRKLLGVPYSHLERIGPARVYAALTQDVTMITGAAQSAPGAVVNVAMLLGGGAYLLYLSPTAFAALASIGVVSFLIYRLMARRARELARRHRQHHDILFAQFRALTEGAKELKLNRDRRRAFVDRDLVAISDDLTNLAVQSRARYLAGQSINGLLVLFAIGFMLFALPGLAHDGGRVASGYVLTALYLMGPLGSLLRLSPTLHAARIALERIAELGLDLQSGVAEPDAAGAPPTGFERVELRRVTHHYPDADEGGFRLGPISFTLVPGEIVCITGANGSGKSTLAKVLVGLYPPDAGELLVDGVPVSAATRDSQRQLFSCVFSDFYLFDRLLGLEREALDDDVRAWLERLGLSDVVTVRQGVLSTTSLSHGQRKRLALLTAALEDRPIYLFDEWAAEQDPAFRQVFYRDLVPELRARGKAVIVITHDDRYLDVANRVLRMQDGQLVDLDG